MATDTIPGTTPVCKAAAAAYWDGALVCEDLALDLERVSETAWVLSCSEVLTEQAQHGFASMALLASRMLDKAKSHEDRLTALSLKHKGETA